MTLVSQIIDDAFRVSNITRTGTSPTTAEQTEALRYLQRILESTFGNEAGEPFYNIPIGSQNIERPSGYPWYNTVPDDNDWFVPENIRLMVNIEEPVELFLHPDPDDGARFAVIDVASNVATHNITINGNGRNIESSNSIVLNTDGVNSEWFYRADLGNWQIASPVGLTDEMPFPVEFDEFFIHKLAMRINPSYGQAMTAESFENYKRAARQLKSRYETDIPTPVETGLTRLSKMTHDRQRWQDRYGRLNPNKLFESGWPY